MPFLRVGSAVETGFLAIGTVVRGTTLIRRVHALRRQGGLNLRCRCVAHPSTPSRSRFPARDPLQTSLDGIDCDATRGQPATPSLHHW